MWILPVVALPRRIHLTHRAWIMEVTVGPYPFRISSTQNGKLTIADFVRVAVTSNSRFRGSGGLTGSEISLKIGEAHLESYPVWQEATL
jgi:hypothetical protein